MKNKASKRVIQRGRIQPRRMGLLWRRTEISRSGSRMTESRTDAYGYNDRNELVSATKSGGSQSPATEYEYSYDDIGNRLSSLDLGTNRTYEANNLNQYTSISNAVGETFSPTFDLDMRPRQRRRVARRSEATEPRSGRKRPRNKNVSELVFFQQANGIAAHYEYAPFGAITATSRNTSVTVYDFREYNPFSFSSEYADGVLRLVYYNYRHYNPVHGRWTGRDVVAEYGGINVYAFCGNSINTNDFLGLDGSKCRCCCAENVSIQIQKNIDGYIQSGKNQMSRFMGHSINVQIVMNEIENDQSTNSCSLVWLERSNINMTIDGRTVPKNQWNHLPSDTWQANQWRENPSFDANGNATKDIRDDPQIEIGRFILHGETIISDRLRTETRILEFDISVISGEGCPCSKDKAQVRATQKLVSINGVPKWEQSSFVIH